ncbi:hypothetical protein BN2475_860015 [Paraburkholderia ribeironis]|uniref:Uncharacterized protein n=1 Tax=Paraburkholderia ribeironis TaxID=1247936 RepID=A0A1N7SKI8_9BURK|nr:hypothetical protein BN2475_860015 [Paraburkholderia ribeironis]
MAVGQESGHKRAAAYELHPKAWTTIQLLGFFVLEYRRAESVNAHLQKIFHFHRKKCLW